MKNTFKGLIFLLIVTSVGFIIWDLIGEYLIELNWELLWIFPIMLLSYLVGKNKKVQKLLQI